MKRPLIVLMFLCLSLTGCFYEPGGYYGGGRGYGGGDRGYGGDHHDRGESRGNWGR